MWTLRDTIILLIALVLIGIGYTGMTSVLILEAGKRDSRSYTFEYLTRPELCAPSSIPLGERMWSEDLEVYLPLDLAWMDCMGVRQWTLK